MSKKTQNWFALSINIILCIIILFLFCIYCSKNKNIQNGGEKTKKTLLDKMVANESLSDNEKLTELEQKKITAEENVKKKNNIYNNLLTNLSSSDEDIEIAELDLDDAKNNLSLAEINYSLKQNMIILKNNKDKEKNEIFKFNVEINKSKQFNIYTMILMNKVKKLRKNTLVAPNDSFFKSELLKTIKETKTYAKNAHQKAKKVYTTCIGSTNPDITKYKSDLNNAKILAENLSENINKIDDRINEQYKLEKTLKKQISLQTKNKKNEKKKIAKETKKQEKQKDSFMDKLTNLFNI
tara:strand:- start:335 stop:1222 length:888 start_codon:yes stop_codon:yes gene_type:complete